ncbi:MAG: SGNH/GDSL hydrolase family protein [bacterium]
MQNSIIRRKRYAILIGLLGLLFVCAAFAEEGGEAREDLSVIYQPAEGIPGCAPDSELPVPAQPCPHLLIDEYLIAQSINVDRVVLQPKRDPAVPNPIVTALKDRSFQPYLTVLRDPESGDYRIWYGAWRDDKDPGHSHLATMRSKDGIHFIRPHQVCDTPEIQFGSEVIDRGPDHPDPSRRYVYSYWLGGGMRILASADGLTWRPLVEGVVLPHDHDITGIDWDPIRKVFVATISTYTTGEKWTGQRRTTMMSVSTDLIHWEKPWFILTASDTLDEGQTQFYAMDGYLTRGPLRIGMVKILRDDLQAAGTEQGSFGRAHTSLAWSRDGRRWVRDRAKFFEPDDDPKAWDHAHAWIDEQLIVGDEVYLYYGGYKQGHKMNRFEERQIGLIKMPLDRYVARRASGSARGLLKTVPFNLDRSVSALKVNADAAGGKLRVQVRNAETREVVPRLSFIDCEPITADGLRQAVQWRHGNLSDAAGQTVQLEFEMTGTDLFAFEFIGQREASATTLPKVLIIGDSISIGYTEPLVEILDGRAVVEHNPGNAQHSGYGLANLDSWLGDTKWDVIHFNHGLHDLKYVDKDGKNTKSKETGHIQIPLDQYKKNMEAIVVHLKKTGAKLIFATTTPFPDKPDGPLREPDQTEKYNAVALRIMKKHGVEVNDLYSFALPRLETLQIPNNVHFTPDGSQALAEEVATHVLNAIEK